MKARTIAGVSTLAVGTLLLGTTGYLWVHFYARDSHATPERAPHVAETLELIKQAEQIGDPLARCLAYPNPPEYHWTRETTNAFCEDQFTPTFGWREFKDAIEDGKASEFDVRLDSLLERYFAGKIPEGAWMYAYSNAFYSASGQNVELVEQWMKQVPGSAHALVARGLQEYSSAVAARGEDSIGNTAADALARMHLADERSREFLERALDINPRIMPAYQALMWISKFESDDELSGSTMQKASLVDPANFYVRAALMDSYEPRWGGSHAAMDRLASDSQVFLSKNPRIANLRGMAEGSDALSLYFDKEYSAALVEFEKGLKEGPIGFYLNLASHSASQLDNDLRVVELTSQMLRFEPNNTSTLRRRAYHLIALDQDAWAITDLERVLQMDPRDTKALKSYSTVLIKQKKFEAAEMKLGQLIAANPEDRWAKENLSWLYGYRLGRVEDADRLIEEMLKMEPEDGSLWLLRIRLLESKSGPRMREAVESFLRFADPNSAEQRNAIPIARNWLAAHPAN